MHDKTKPRYQKVGVNKKFMVTQSEKCIAHIEKKRDQQHVISNSIIQMEIHNLALKS
jgi:hypothetical protein